jgi:hypothetical protein
MAYSCGLGKKVGIFLSIPNEKIVVLLLLFSPPLSIFGTKGTKGKKRTKGTKDKVQSTRVRLVNVYDDVSG